MNLGDIMSLILNFVMLVLYISSTKNALKSYKLYGKSFLHAPITMAETRIGFAIDWVLLTTILVQFNRRKFNFNFNVSWKIVWLLYTVCIFQIILVF